MSASKGDGELSYWTKRSELEGGSLQNKHYERFYTELFDLSHSDYEEKRVLDVGCGPRGSLEWAHMASERVGVDPLADRYLELGAKDHNMRYVASPAERMPFETGYFDIVCSFNSLDHVDNLRQTIKQLKRVTRSGGLFLLLTDIHQEPTPQEPITFSWDVVERFEPEFAVQTIQHFEKRKGMYESLDRHVPYNHADPSVRYGVLMARFVRRNRAGKVWLVRRSGEI